VIENLWYAQAEKMDGYVDSRNNFSTETCLIPVDKSRLTGK